MNKMVFLGRQKGGSSKPRLLGRIYRLMNRALPPSEKGPDAILILAAYEDDKGTRVVVGGFRPKKGDEGRGIASVDPFDARKYVLAWAKDAIEAEAGSNGGGTHHALGWEG